MKTPGCCRAGLGGARSVAALLALALFSHVATGAPFVVERYPLTINSNSVRIELEAYGEVPELMAVVVQKGGLLENHKRTVAAWAAEIKTNRGGKLQGMPLDSLDHTFDGVRWTRFQTNLLVDLGPGNGERTIRFSYRYKGQARANGWSGSSVTVRTSLPVIWIVNPTNSVLSQPLIQLQGYASHHLQRIRYDRLNQEGETVASNQEAHPSANFNGGFPFRPGENYFTCFDVPLERGTNTIVLHCTDDAGNEMSTNLVFVFTTEGDLTPPLLGLQWPQNGRRIAARSFTARGQSDDATATFAGWISAGGKTNPISGFPESNGYFWFEDMPLALGENQLTLTATDVAGNTARTNLVLYGEAGPIISLDPIEPAKLWQASITITGKVSPVGESVWINGVQAKVKPDGTWLAERVPVNSPNGGGTAIFEMTTVPAAGADNGIPKAKESVSAQASLGTNAMVLNASSPACGGFQLHLTGTAGRSFILFASTNLLEWTPILTNSGADATFDFTDVNAENFNCRFFRVVPLP